MVKKPKIKTIQMYKKWRNGKYALYAGAVASPLVPATIVTLINWEEWFDTASYSLPYGFASLILTVVIAIVGILNSETIFKKADVALFCLAGLFMCVGLTCLFLASLLSQMGFMWLYVGAGLLASGACVEVENRVFEPKIALYKEVIKENNLTKRTQADVDIKKQAKEDAKKVVW